jgi:3-hydroxy-9,10-secoandrosta-1,3,5(10)-triene-9,17-dione monooxygenase
MTASALAPPEPGLTGADLLRRAQDLRPAVEAEAEAAEQAGTYSAALHERFTAAGFYRILQPRRYGGYELELADFYRVVIEISRGDAGIGWNLALGAAHALQVGAFFPERAQEELFGPDGHFVGPSRAIPRGTATHADGGFQVTGRWDYCSGATYSTHAIVLALVQSADGTPTGERVMVAIPRAEYEVIDDWGGAQTIGLRSTASNSIAAHDVFVPAHRAVRYDWKDFEMPADGTVGFRLHGNPLYIHRAMSFFYATLNATQIGNARAALDVYETMMRERPTSFPPPIPRSESVDYQRWYGDAASLIDTAELAFFGALARYAAKSRGFAERREPFTVADDGATRDVIAHTGRLAWEAVDLMFATGGTTAARTGSRLQRCFRDGAMFRTHIGAQYDVVHASTGRARLGQPLTH